MACEVEAVYERGILRPLGSLPFAEHERVKITVASVSVDPLDAILDHTAVERARKKLASAGRVRTHEEVWQMTSGDISSWSEAIIAERNSRP